MVTLPVGVLGSALVSFYTPAPWDLVIHHDALDHALCKAHGGRHLVLCQSAGVENLDALDNDRRICLEL